MATVIESKGKPRLCSAQGCTDVGEGFIHHLLCIETRPLSLKVKGNHVCAVHKVAQMWVKASYIACCSDPMQVGLCSSRAHTHAYVCARKSTHTLAHTHTHSRATSHTHTHVWVLVWCALGQAAHASHRRTLPPRPCCEWGAPHVGAPCI